MLQNLGNNERVHVRVFLPVLVCLALVCSALGLTACSSLPFGSTGAGGQDASGASSSSSQNGSQSSDVQGTKTLDEYSWEELSQISAQISAAGSADERTQIAQQAGIEDPEGNIVDQTKRVDLTNGYSIDARVIGVGHDTREDGSVVGLTFMTVGAMGRASMNGEDTVRGGWEASSLRASLSTDYLPLFPDELRSLMVPVTKLTNNRGSVDDTTSVSSTTDSLWLLSAREVCGDISWEKDEYGDTRYGLDATLNAEGQQYQYFSQIGVNQSSSNASLTLDASSGKSSWWLRTPFPSLMRSSDAGAYYYCVSDAGNPSAYVAPTSNAAVVVCFCV